MYIYIYCNVVQIYSCFNFNAGGYIGLFIGYTVSQIPELVYKIMKHGKEVSNNLFGGKI